MVLAMRLIAAVTAMLIVLEALVAWLARDLAVAGREARKR